jgi:hypothetical protein
MKITVRKFWLTDGSPVFNIELRQGSALIELGCPSEMEARSAAALIRDAARETLEDVPEFDVVTRP